MLFLTNKALTVSRTVISLGSRARFVSPLKKHLFRCEHPYHGSLPYRTRSYRPLLAHSSSINLFWSIDYFFKKSCRYINNLMCLINITYLINKQVYHPCAYLAFIFTTGNFPLPISNLPGLLKLQKNCLVVCPLFNCNSLAVWKLGRGMEGGIPTRKRENGFVGHFFSKRKTKKNIFLHLYLIEIHFWKLFLPI